MNHEGLVRICSDQNGRIAAKTVKALTLNWLPKDYETPPTTNQKGVTLTTPSDPPKLKVPVKLHQKMLG